ncbi:hypothetical protein [Echinicola shivajiensis]|uniref:hypothetical protein n=1 Tax=Echinicola shivajiensis TaxID=1035916 RepID=UPI001BFCA0B6|nr:hypothetical protein [Echinicola shivajiensis]
MLERIFTIDARGNIFLKLMSERFNLSSLDIQKEIYSLFKELKFQLIYHNINYSELKNVLIPNRDRKELLLIFDPSKFNSSIYGSIAMDVVLQSLGTVGKHSILGGDFIFWGNSPSSALDLVIRSCEWKDAPPDTFFEPFFIYVNNLSNHKFQKVKSDLLSKEYCIGYSDLTFHSIFKESISLSLSNAFILLNDRVIVPNEDYKMMDNPTMYDFQKHGIKINSIQDILYGVFLSYKIERRVYQGFQDDFKFSLNAVTESTSNPDKIKVRIKEEKFNDYLHTTRKKNLELLGIDHLTKGQLERFLEHKISSNYIYNLEINEHGIKKFVINIENNTQSKLVLVFEYLQDVKMANLLTAY